MIKLREITPDNYQEARKLDVRPDQQNFVAPIIKSLADAFVYKQDRFRLAYAGEAIVGYTLITPYQREGRQYINIIRLMIDQKYQGRGLGRALLKETLQWIDTFEPKPEIIRISAVPENEPAIALYKSEGFIAADIEEGELALYLTLR